VIGDGAIWIWNIADEHFPTATQIVDLYHARQHLWELSGKLFSSDLLGQVTGKKRTAREPLLKSRKLRDDVQNRSL